ncbi:LOW QUALITY PROTEIN: xylosyl- and glucuronyltransferase LARGE1-like [Ciona intestinalis]
MDAYRSIKRVSNRNFVTICVVFIVTYFLMKRFLQNENTITLGKYESESESDLQTQTNIQKPSQCETNHVFIVCTGYKTIKDMVVLVKSILFHRKDSLHFHYLVDNVSKPILKELFRTWDIPDFEVSMYEDTAVLDDVSWVPFTHYSGINSVYKLAILKVLPLYIHKVIVLDSDMVFATDIAELWSQFKYMDQQQAFGMVENQSDWYLGTLKFKYVVWPAIGRGLNSGMMLLDCEKLKSANWDLKWKETAQQGIKRFKTVPLADQDIINLFLVNNKHMLYKLECNWNLQLPYERKMELCYNDHKHDVKNNPLEQWRKHNINSDQIQGLTNLFTIYLEMNGMSLRHQAPGCTQRGEVELYADDNLTKETDICDKFAAQASSKHRTHIYYLPFNHHIDSRDITLVTHLHLNDMQAFETLCKTWTGPISVAIFVADSETDRLEYFIHSSDILKRRDNIGYHLVFKGVNEQVAPIGYLLNTATSQVITEYLLIYDVTYQPAQQLYDILYNYFQKPDVISLKSVYVLPLFETTSDVLLDSTPSTKVSIVKQISVGEIKYSNKKRANSFDIVRWANATKPYLTDMRRSGTPIIFALRKQHFMQLFDSFLDSDQTRIALGIELDAAGYKFFVLPTAFAVSDSMYPSNHNLYSIDIKRCTEKTQDLFFDYLKRKYPSFSRAKYFY